MRSATAWASSRSRQMAPRLISAPRVRETGAPVTAAIGGRDAWLVTAHAHDHVVICREPRQPSGFNVAEQPGVQLRPELQDATLTESGQEARMVSRRTHAGPRGLTSTLAGPRRAPTGTIAARRPAGPQGVAESLMWLQGQAGNAAVAALASSVPGRPQPGIAVQRACHCGGTCGSCGSEEKSDGNPAAGVQRVATAASKAPADVAPRMGGFADVRSLQWCAGNAAVTIALQRLTAPPAAANGGAGGGGPASAGPSPASLNEAAAGVSTISEHEVFGAVSSLPANAAAARAAVPDEVAAAREQAPDFVDPGAGPSVEGLGGGAVPELEEGSAAAGQQDEMHDGAGGPKGMPGGGSAQGDSSGPEALMNLTLPTFKEPAAGPSPAVITSTDPRHNAVSSVVREPVVDVAAERSGVPLTGEDVLARVKGIVGPVLNADATSGAGGATSKPDSANGGREELMARGHAAQAEAESVITGGRQQLTLHKASRVAAMRAAAGARAGQAEGVGLGIEQGIRSEANSRKEQVEAKAETERNQIEGRANDRCIEAESEAAGKAQAITTSSETQVHSHVAEAHQEAEAKLAEGQADKARLEKEATVQRSKDATVQRSWVGDAWDATKGAASSAWDATKGAASAGWEATKGAASSAWEATKGAASTAWDVTKSVAGAVSDFAVGLYHKAQAAWHAAVEWAKQKYEAAKQWVKEAIATAKRKLTELGQWIAKKARDVRDWAVQQWRRLASWVKQKWAELKAWCKKVLLALVGYLKRAIAWLWKALKFLVKLAVALTLFMIWTFIFIFAAIRAVFYWLFDAVFRKKDPVEGPCDVKLGFLPLHALTKLGVAKDKAYIAAVHTFLYWNGDSAGYTADKDAFGKDEPIADAHVYSPEPRIKEVGDIRWVAAQWDMGKKGKPGYPDTCEEVYAHFKKNVVVGALRGQYSLLSLNCETYAREMLASAAMTAGPTPDGGYGNTFAQYLQKDPVWGLRRWAKDHGLGILPPGL